MRGYYARHFVTNSYGQRMAIFFRAPSLRAALLKAYERGWSDVHADPSSYIPEVLALRESQASRRDWDSPELTQEQIRGMRAAAQAQLTAEHLAPRHIYPNRFKAPS